MSIVWLILMVVLVVIEGATVALTTVWFAFGSLAALLLSLVHAPLWLQILAFLAVSLVLLFFTRPVAQKYFNRDRIRTNAERLIGEKAVVLEKIDNLRQAGLVSVRGQEWTARSEAAEIVILQDTVVEVKNISGVKLIVSPVNPELEKGGV